MSIDELIEVLQEAREDLGGDAEVRLAMQPNWPFEYTIRNGTASAEGVIYLAEGRQLDYLPGEISQEFGWK